MPNETNLKYSWNVEKREQNIRERGLDIVEYADFIFTAPDAKFVLDNRNEYGEDRYKVYATFGDERFCLCFTPRENVFHLITIHKVHEKKWRKLPWNK
jgi:uncharacterized DUF497 family protein